VEGRTKQQDLEVSSFRTKDPEEAIAVVASAYVPHELRLPRHTTSIDMSLTRFELESMTVGSLHYGPSVSVRTEETHDFCVALPTQGRIVSRHRTREAVISDKGEPVIYSPGAPADAVWAPGSTVLALNMATETLEGELERLLGTSLRAPLRFTFTDAEVTAEARRWQAVLRLLAEESRERSGYLAHVGAARHVESLMMDGLLLSQAHNYSDAVHRQSPRVSSAAVQRAVDLLEQHPEEQWSMVRLSSEAHLSVRSLQEGFRRELDETPMAYLKSLRLRRARRALAEASAEDTTVKAVAVSCGLMHAGRFAAEYRAAFGESPSETLHRSHLG
jgi:AraC-like DNA-binding protein